MSNFRAIATVSATLQRTLQEAVQADVGGALVTTVRPAEGDDTDLPATGVNLFLYQVTTNPSWRNADLPTRRDDGQVIQRPQAALNLHYLLSFYGGDLTLEPQRLLGSTMAYLHSQPLLTRAQIQAAVGDAAKPFLADSDLANQVDLVRFTPLPMTLEELSRLWSLFVEVSYVLSIAYQAAVVLVEPDVSPRPALPARDFSLATLPLPKPFVRRVVAEAGETAPILRGGAVAAEGDALRADAVAVEIDGAPVTPAQVLDDRVVVPLPPDLAAGPHVLVVRHGALLGSPAVSHLAFSSNPAAFVMQPAITQTNGAYDIEISDVTGAGPDPRAATVVIGVEPPVAARQTATLEMLAGAEVRHTFMAAPRDGAASELTFAISGVTAGVYLFRVRVDGAQSPLDLDAGGTPIAPEETIP
jgi:hypothetical protein